MGRKRLIDEFIPEPEEARIRRMSRKEREVIEDLILVKRRPGDRGAVRNYYTEFDFSSNTLNDLTDFEE